MKKSRKIVSVLVALSLALSLFTPAFAAPSNAQNIRGGIIETVNSNNEIVRVYVKSTPEVSTLADSTDDTCSDTKTLLLNLGMEDCFIQALSSDTLCAYSDSPIIYTVVSYIKADGHGNVSVVDEETALTAAQFIDNKQMDTAVSRAGYENQFEDSYMRITFTVSYKRQGIYHYSIDSTWLTMPYFRGWDSLGGCVQVSTVVNNSRSGWYSYDYFETSENGSARGSVARTNFDQQYFKNAINGNWHGSAVVFDVPDDIYVSKYAKKIENYRVHYEFDAQVISFSLPQSFSATATYDHATVGLSINPSVSVNLSGVKPSIGISAIAATESRTVELPTPIVYNP